MSSQTLSLSRAPSEKAMQEIREKLIFHRLQKEQFLQQSATARTKLPSEEFAPAICRFFSNVFAKKWSTIFLPAHF